MNHKSHRLIGLSIAASLLTVACSPGNLKQSLTSRLSGKSNGDSSAEDLQITDSTVAGCSTSGSPELVKLNYRFFALNSDGSTGNELIYNKRADGIPEASVSIGSQVIIRTQMKDCRPAPTGIFSAYHDMTLSNLDGSAAQRLDYAWGEFNQIEMAYEIKAGSFKLMLDSIPTGAISPVFFDGYRGKVFDEAATASRIRIALETHPRVGKGNVLVSAATSSAMIRFGIIFTGMKSRRDMPALSIVSNSLVDGNGKQVAASVSKNSIDPSQSIVSSAGRRHSLKNEYPNASGASLMGQSYSETPGGFLRPIATMATARTVSMLGGTSNKNKLSFREAGMTVNVVDAVFVATKAGQVKISGSAPNSAAPGPKLGIALFGDAGKPKYLSDSQLKLPTGLINVVNK